MCGRSPSVQIKVKEQTGLVVVHNWQRWEGAACRDCGTSIVRKALVHNLFAGWWGVISFLVNPITMVSNLRASSELARLAPPVGAPLAPPVPAVKPLWRRPLLLAAPLVVVGVIVALVHLWPSQTSVDELSAGACFDMPTEVTFSNVTTIDCSDPHDAQVVGTIPGGTVETGVGQCEDVAFDFVGRTTPVSGYRYDGIVLDQGGVVCVIESADGSKLEAGLRVGAN